MNEWMDIFKRLSTAEQLAESRKMSLIIQGRWLEAHRRLSIEKGWDKEADFYRLLALLDEIEAEET